MLPIFTLPKVALLAIMVFYEKKNQEESVEVYVVFRIQLVDHLAPEHEDLTCTLRN